MDIRPLRRLFATGWPPLGDVALATVLSVVPVLGDAVTTRPRRANLAAVVLVALAQTVPLAWRRVRPVAVLAVAVAATVALFALTGRYEWVGAVVALYTVAGRCERPVAVGAGLATLLALGVVAGLDRRPGAAIENTVWLAMVWVIGAYLGELRARTRRAERERELEARRAVADEQARIARELHDVIAHNVSVMLVQAAAGEDVFDERPDRAREALTAIQGAGREALTELRHLLNAEGGDGLPLAPQPRLDRLDWLAGQVRAAGLLVDVRVEGRPFPLPSGVDMAAYRIVQEALTNTLKHARASRAAVLVRYGPTGVVLDVSDDGHGPAGGGAGGRGIIGMRERAALYGGYLWAGPAPGVGFRVYAHLPVGPAPP
jgi:signal transduction histidine kinase